MKKIFSIILIAVFSLMLTGSAQAATFASGEEYSLTNPTEGNTYVAGGMVTIDAEVGGDLHAAGGNIAINNNVYEDATVAGGYINLNADIGEDARFAGGNVFINGDIGGDLLVAGGYLSIGPNTQVWGDTTLAGGRVIINGTINGDLQIFGAEVEVRGEVLGNVFAEIDESLVITGTSNIHGNLVYKSQKTAEIKPGASITGQTMHEKVTGWSKKTHKTKISGSALVAIFTGLFLVKLLILLTLALIIGLVMIKPTKELVDRINKKFGSELLRGLIVIIVVPIASLLMLITIIGSPFALLSMAVFGILMILTKALAAITLGSMLFKFFSKKKELRVNWKTITVGVLVISLVKLIPLIGWVAYAVLFLAALGTLSMHVYEHFQKCKTGKC